MKKGRDHRGCSMYGFDYVEGAMDVETDIGYEYRGLHQRAMLGRLLGVISGRPRSLRSLAEAMDGYRICGQHDGGLKTVPLRRIVGSEGRCADFDRDFRPLKTHTRQRWYNVARAHLTEVNLPPVDLIRVGDEYYVRDGNHRVSVARAFGLKAIEAIVTEYHLLPRTTFEVRAPVAGGALRRELLRDGT